MRPGLHARLLNGRGGDPALHVEARHLAGAVLLDCGEIGALSPRQLLRIGALGVSHAHMDHWAGFDRLLRLLLGREKTLPVLGPAGMAERLYHRLHAYTWNLADRIAADLVFEVTEVTATPPWRRTGLRLHGGWRPEPMAPVSPTAEGAVLELGALLLHAAVLEHEVPCLGFALAERAHANVWRTRLEALGLPTGPWVSGLKAAVLAGLPDDHPIPVFARAALPPRSMPLGALRGAVTVSPGQRIAYLTDFADTLANRAAAVALAHEADLLFIEAPFLAEDAAHAAERRHLTARAAGEIARAAGVRRIEPFHFSPRYREEGEARLLAEVQAAFRGEAPAA